MALYNDVKVFARSWHQHFGMQFATLTVLVATFSVVAFMLGLSFNFQRVLTLWGEHVQVSAYLEDDMRDGAIENLKNEIAKRPGVLSVEFVSKEKAANSFRDQMASYAPDLMSDSEFATPFPASLQIRLRDDPNHENRVEDLEKLAKELKSKDGIEDVSYGQSWVRNYSSFVTVVQTAGAIVGCVLLFGSVFIVANSIRTLISGRREEIEIFELIGATSGNIRRPYIFEGILHCVMAAITALIINAALYGWLISIMKQSLAFGRMAEEFQFLSLGQIAIFVLFSGLLGGIGAWLTVRSLNDGWAAARGVRS